MEAFDPKSKALITSVQSCLAREHGIPATRKAIRATLEALCQHYDELGLCLWIGEDTEITFTSDMEMDED